MVELIDILTSDGATTGVTKARSQVHVDGDWHRTVHVWVMNSQQELLLQKRAAAKESHPGLWDVSCAGHVPAGDDSRHAAVRELREELGLAVKPDALRYLYRFPSFFVFNKGTFIDREMVDVYLLVRNVKPHDIRLQAEEVEAVTLVSVKTFQARVERSDPSLVPHKEAYHRLLAYLHQKSA
ncbi:NUDIX domain-containing protein [Thermodesulfobacteriota bacterium]